jgi:hypothetical protein
MLLQLETDGHINNLEEYPALLAFEQNYIHWFEEFIEGYHDDTHRAYMAKHYTDYGNRIKALWVNRPKRPYVKYQKFLIGKTVSKETVKEETINEIVSVSHEDIKSSLLLINE